MRILIIQTLFPKGHKSLDSGFITLLSKDYELIVVDDGHYFSSDLFIKPNVQRIIIPRLIVNRWETLKTVLRRIHLIVTFFVLRLRKVVYDQILFLNFDNDIYKIEYLLPSKKRLLIHHNDIDILFSCKETYYKQFDLVKNRFHHICLADYISESFQSFTNIEKSRVFTVHQPIVFDDTKVVDKEELLVGIGNSMEEAYIEELLSLDKDTVLPCKLILRSKSKEYKGQNMEIFSGFLKRDEYEKLYDRAKASLVTYPSHYRFRYSGIIDDSLSKGLIVFSNDTICGRYFSIVYPNSVIIIRDVKHLWELLRKGLPKQPDSERKLFKERHSDQYILKQFKKAIDN